MKKIKNNKKGFTLVELLAVIVILAIILVIAVPKVMSVIEDSKKATLESTAKMIASAAEKAKVQNTVLGKNDEITCDSVAKINNLDYASCSIEFIDNTAKVTIEGKGKFEGLCIYNGTKIDASATKEGCNICPEEQAFVETLNVTKPYVINYENCVSYLSNVLPEFGAPQTAIDVLPNICKGETSDGVDFSFLVSYVGLTDEELVKNNVIEGSAQIEKVCVPNYADNAVLHIKNLYNDSNVRIKLGLTKDNTVDQNIRYSGMKPNNYVEFGNEEELWRIIGIFEVETEEGPEELVKIVREDSIGHIAWDTSESNVNSGNGVNQWGEIKDANGNITYDGADLMQLLNENYLNKQDTELACCDWETYDSSKDIFEYHTCDFSNIGISSTYKNMIETVEWNTAAVDFGDSNIFDPETYSGSTVELYNAERGTVGKLCNATDEDGNANKYCNDTVTRTSTWKGQVALSYPTDWVYASSENICRTNLFAGRLDYTNTCRRNNWMHYGTSDGIYSNQTTWFLSPIADLTYGFNVFGLLGDGVLFSLENDQPFRVQPSLYLKSSVKIIDGDGSSEKPYKLKLS